MSDAQSAINEDSFAQSNHDFYYRTWMRQGRPKPFDEWMKDRQQIPCDYCIAKGREWSPDCEKNK